MADQPRAGAQRTPLRHHLALCVYWLSNTLMWGALLHLAIQSRLSDWFGEHQVGYYFALIGFAGGVLGTLSQIVFGGLSDRSTARMGRRRPFLIAGSTSGAVALLLLGWSSSFWPFAVALMALQLTSNMALGPFTALLPDTVPPHEHGTTSGFMGIARLAGDTGGMMLAALLLSTKGMPGRFGGDVAAFHDERMFVLCAIIAASVVLMSLITVVTIRERPQQGERRPLREIVAGSFQFQVRANRDFFWLSLSRAVTNLGLYMFLEAAYFFVRYALGAPDPERTVMWIMLPAIGAAVAGSLPSGILSDRIGRKPLIYGAQFAMAAGALVFTLAPSLTVAFIAAVPAGIGYGVFTAVEWALACNLVPRDHAARYLGFWNLSAIVPQILGFVVAGVIGSSLARFSHIAPGFGWRVDYAIGVICAVAGAYFLKFVHERRPA